MATSYATRLTSALAPVVERARRWSQSSAADIALHSPTITTIADARPESTVPDSLVTRSRPISPASSPTGVTLTEIEDSASEQTLIADPSTAPLQTVVPIHATSNLVFDGSSSGTLRSPGIPLLEGTNMSASSEVVNGLSVATSKPTELPEDDGQRLLRQRLLDIAREDIPEREKAHRMHHLMTEKWNLYRSQSAVENDAGQQLVSIGGEDNTENPYKLFPGDDKTTYYTGLGSSNDGVELGCAHYRRNNRLQCSTCERWYTCRFCHDEEEDHSLIRQQTRNMLCMPCGRPQPAQQDCRYCGTRSARYYCDKCKLWDDDPDKPIYHCADCGICRIGRGLGKDFFHCKKCGVCMSIRLENSHRCIERSTECDCPICGEYMFTSTMTVVFMTCGHSIHHKCYYEHMNSSYRCPTCARTIVNMESQFRALDVEIENQPLPPPYNDWRSLISCNDCSAKSDVPFHFLGLKCDNCSSYNTSQMRTIRPEDSPRSRQTSLSVDATSTVTSGAESRILVGGTSDSRPIFQHSSSASSRAIAAAEEAMEVAMGFDHGDDDLLVDDGWVTDSLDDCLSDGDNSWPWSDVDRDEQSHSMDDDDDDDDSGELINLRGHL